MSTTKNVPFTAAQQPYPECVQQPVTRRGANKRYSDREDVMILFALLNAKKVSLHMFTATTLA
jgi:hypothetical protein